MSSSRQAAQQIHEDDPSQMDLVDTPSPNALQPQDGEPSSSTTVVVGSSRPRQPKRKAPSNLSNAKTKRKRSGASAKSKGKRVARDDEASDDDEPEDDGTDSDDDDDDTDNAAESGTTGKVDEVGPDTSKPPLSNLRDIIGSMLESAQPQGLHHYVDSGQQYYIRVGTICSGTDAPLHVMNLFGMLKNDKGEQVFTTVNAFGCEIEPFKQAFLMRNSKPQLLFRDAQDFTKPGAKLAHLVSGVEAEIPKVDLFIAGTACVDFSGLNSNRTKGFEGLAEANDRWKRIYQDRLKKNPDAPLTRQDLNPDDWRKCIEGLTQKKGVVRTSSITFAGAMNYIYERQPLIVIFENVETAPWQSTIDYVFPLCGYIATFVSLDTKNYYLPQTRCRKYLIAFSQDAFTPDGAKALCKAFQEAIKKMEQRYSSSVTDFLLPINSHELHRARNEMELMAQSSREKDTDWSFSRSRHTAFRRLYQIPDERPWIRWSERGSSRAPAKMWKPWEAKQTNRVSDLLECVFLIAVFGRNTKHSAYDPRHKAQIIDCSQNVDRVNMATAFGATGCLTPSAIPVLTLEARPITGSEALKLQGLPIESFDMSSETQTQLQDLAGNAMTTTVVGAVILAALCCVAERSADNANDNDDNHRLHSLSTLFGRRGHQDAVVLDGSSFELPTSALDLGRRQALDVVLSSSARPNDAVARIIGLGRIARRRCECYHILSYSSMELFVCEVCGAWLCKSCKGNPGHALVKSGQSFDQIGSLTYANAEDRLRKFFPAVLPMISTMGQDDAAHLAGILVSSACELPESAVLARAIVDGLSSTTYELKFIEVTDAVRIEYVAKDSFILRVILDNSDDDDKKLTWYLHVDQWSEAGTKLSGSRHKTSQPIARAVLRSNAPSQFPEEWSFWLPLEARFELCFRLLDDRRNLQLSFIFSGVEGLHDDVQSQIQPLQGTTWTYHPECGFPEDAFWVCSDGPTAEKLFMFKDVNPVGPANKDEFVISAVNREMGRTPTAECRPVLLRISADDQIHQIIKKMEAGDKPVRDQEFVVSAFLTGRWISPQEHPIKVPAFINNDVNDLALQNFPSCPPADFRLLTRDLPSGGLKVSAAAHDATGEGSCQRDQVLVTMSLPIFGKSDRAIAATLKKVKDLDLTQQLDLAEFNRLIGPCYAAIERAVLALEQDGVHNGRMQIAEEDLTSDCGRCAPKMPKVVWQKADASGSKTFGSVVAKHQKDDQEVYDVNISSKPSALRIDHNVNAALVPHSKKKAAIPYIDIRIVGRAQTLMQEARSHLPEHPAYYEDTDLTRATFALDFGVLEDPRPELPAIVIQAPKSPKDLGRAVTQPQGFRQGEALFDEQLASLEWMLERESVSDEFGFPERELAEVYISDLRLRAVAQVSRHITRLGRVVADSVGFGKTAVSLGLIDKQYDTDRTEFMDLRKNNDQLTDMIHLHATLVIVPNQLTRQWEQEAKRFLHGGYKVHVIQTCAQLQSMSIAAFQNADIIICSNKIFQEPRYLAELFKYCDPNGIDVIAVPKVYRAWYKQALKTLHHVRGQVVALNQTSSTTGYNSILEALRSNLASFQDDTSSFSTPGSLSSWRPLTLLEFFSFSRVIWDEFPYENIRVTEFVANVATLSKWMLSGTPPLTTLGDICKIAYLFNVHLAGPLSLVNGRQPPICDHPPTRPLSTLEEAHLYQSRNSSRLLQERHEQALEFVAMFMRKNVRVMKDINSVQKPVVLSMSTNSLLAYLELQQELSSRTFNGNMVAADPRRRLMNLVDWKVKMLGTERAMEALTLRASSSFKDVQDQSANAAVQSVQSATEVASAIYAMSKQSIQDLEDLGRELIGKALYLAYRNAFINLREHTSKIDSQEARHFDYYKTLELAINSIVELDVEQYCGWDAFESALRILIWDDDFHKQLESTEDGINSSSSVLPPRTNKHAWGHIIRELWARMNFGTAPNATLEPAQKGRQSSVTKKKEYLHKFSKLLTKTPLHSRRWFSVAKIQERQLPEYVQEVLKMEWHHKVPWEAKFRSARLDEVKHTFVPIRELQRPSSDEQAPQTDFSFEQMREHDNARLQDQINIPPSTSNEVEAKIRRRTKKARITKADWQEECMRLGLIAKSTDSMELLRNRVIMAEAGKATEDYYISPEGCLPTIQDVPLEGKQRIRGGSMEVCFDQLMHTVDKLSVVLERLVVAHCKKNLQRVIWQVIEQKWRCTKEHTETGHRLEEKEALRTHYVSLLCGHVHCSLPQGIDLDTAVCGVRGCTHPLVDVCIPLSKLLEPARVVRTDDLGQGALESEPAHYLDPQTEHQGPKATLVVNLINAMPAGDQVVVFVQNKTIMDGVYQALAESNPKITHVSRQDLLKGESEALETFKMGGARVLVQIINSEQAAGSNLHNANHIIFVSPLITRSQTEWDAQMKQALGRCIRFRQEKTVHVYHLVMNETVEVDALEWRMKKEILVSAGRAAGRFNDCTVAEFLDRFDSKEEPVTAGGAGDEGRAISLLPRDDIQMLMGDDYISLTAARTTRTVDSVKAGRVEEGEAEDGSPGEGGGKGDVVMG